MYQLYIAMYQCILSGHDSGFSSRQITLYIYVIAKTELDAREKLYELVKKDEKGKVKEFLGDLIMRDFSVDKLLQRIQSEQTYVERLFIPTKKLKAI